MKKITTPRLNARLSVNISDKFLARLIKGAKRNKVSTSEFVRAVLEETLQG